METIKNENKEKEIHINPDYYMLRFPRVRRHHNVKSEVIPVEPKKQEIAEA